MGSPAVSATYVYLMREVNKDLIKIGLSNSVFSRKKQLIYQKGYTLKVIACKQFDTRRAAQFAETFLHRRYKKVRIEDELFKLNQIEIEDILSYFVQSQYNCPKEYFHAETKKYAPTIEEIESDIDYLSTGIEGYVFSEKLKNILGVINSPNFSEIEKLQFHLSELQLNFEKLKTQRIDEVEAVKKENAELKKAYQTKVESNVSLSLSEIRLKRQLDNEIKDKQDKESILLIKEEMPIIYKNLKGFVHYRAYVATFLFMCFGLFCSAIINFSSSGNEFSQVQFISFFIFAIFGFIMSCFYRKYKHVDTIKIKQKFDELCELGIQLDAKMSKSDSMIVHFQVNMIMYMLKKIGNFKDKRAIYKNNTNEKTHFESIIKGYEAALQLTDKEAESEQYAELSNILESNRAILKRLN